MKTTCLALLFTLTLTLIGELAAAPSGAPALSRIFLHRDGNRTETEKNSNAAEWHESTYNKDNILISYRVYNTDPKGRPRTGLIYDGKKTLLAKIAYGYHPQTDQLIEEQIFREGKLVRRLFYPGALKDPRFAKRFVAFNYDPSRPGAAPVADTKNVSPTQPVQSEQEEFQPGVPMGKPLSQASEPGAQHQPLPAPAKRTIRTFLQQHKAKKP